MKTKLEIIEETVAFYSKDPSKRAINPANSPDPTCVYLTKDGRKCAVGRYMLHPEMYEGSIRHLVDYKGFKQENLVEEVQGHDWSFWEELQLLHDSVYNWHSLGMSAIGEKRVNHLIKKYGEGDGGGSDLPGSTR